MARASRSPGRPRGKPAGSWVDELASLGKAICLCFKCQRKFNHKAHGYQRRRFITSNMTTITSDCDGCKTTWITVSLFLKRTT